MIDSSERPHRTSSSTGELFICFTSRLSSSSSMKISSKSILSPGRARDPPVSLSTSLSRRLRTNRSLRGGQSPMFPTGGKKRFENTEPSSPKVTCIGQVRVKTKKKQGMKNMRTLSTRREGGDVSFRRVEPGRVGLNQGQQECLPHRNQRWVHLPLTICEALRALGAEFSCLFPCRSSCVSREERDKEEEKLAASNEETGRSSCGAVFARWLVAVQDGEVGKGREIELVVGGEEEDSGRGIRERTLRRHAGEESDFGDERFEVREGEEARVSICIPPKNALLLMRCRSDPVRVSALANSLSQPLALRGEVEEDDERQEEEEDDGERSKLEEEGEVLIGDSRVMEEKEVGVYENLFSIVPNVEEESPEAEGKVVMEVQEDEGEENPEEEMLEICEEMLGGEENLEPEVQESNQTVVPDENEFSVSSSEAVLDLENMEYADALLIPEEEEEEEARRTSHDSSSVVSVRSDFAEEKEEAVVATLEKEEESTDEKETLEELPSVEEEEEEEEEEEIVTQERSETEETQKEEECTESEGREQESHDTVERENEVKEKQERETSAALPDCLLLMRCEPKLSMEVSKETWVCSTDFIRWLPERPVNAINGKDEPKKRFSTDSNKPARHKHHFSQPPRSSCSLPATAAASMATMIEQKLVNAVGCEPFVLTRCKSEPMRTAAAKLAPETCFWKNRKLEPHRRSTIGVGAAGVGF